MSTDQFVYFVRRVDGEGPVKIGVSCYPETRLTTLQTWAPYPLETAATLPGSGELERRFHARFAAQHSHREWFHPSDELTATIAAIQAGKFDIGTLPDPRCITANPTRRAVSENSKLGMSWGHRLRHLERRGVNIPADVASAARRWGAGPFSNDYDPGNPADRATVEAYLENHPPLAKRRAAR